MLIRSFVVSEFQKLYKILYTQYIRYYIFLAMDAEKPIYWTSSSKQELLKFPDDIRKQIGYQLGLLQLGIAATDVKPVKGLGKGVKGVYEIRCQDEDNQR